MGHINSRDYMNVTVWQIGLNLVKSGQVRTPVEIYFNLSYEVKHRRICRSDNGGATNIHTFSKETVTLSDHFDIYMLKKYYNVYHKICPMLFRLGIDRRYHDFVLEKIICFAHKIGNWTSNMGRQVLPLFVKLERVHDDYYVYHERCLITRALRESMLEFEDRNRGMLPACKSSMKVLLTRVKFEGENYEEGGARKRKRSNENCTICLEELAVGSYATCMPCKHMFHHKCIVRWLEESHYCPVCRFELPT